MTAERDIKKSWGKQGETYNYIFLSSLLFISSEVPNSINKYMNFNY
jgi:hypothetical protein